MSRVPAQSPRERAKNRFPSVLLTLLSMVQALALELAWSGLRDHEHLWAGGLPAVIGWLQVSAVALGIVVVWIFYTSLVMRLVWIPTTLDFVLPFVVGISEFLLAQMLAPTMLHWWLFLLAWLFGLSSWTSSRTFRVASTEPDNRAFFERLPPAKHDPNTLSFTFVGIIALAGVAVLILGPGGIAALVALITANAVLLYQAAVIRGFWIQSMEGDDDEEEAGHADGVVSVEVEDLG